MTFFARLRGLRQHGGFRPRRPDESVDEHLQYLEGHAVGGAGLLATDVRALLSRVEELERRVSEIEEPPAR